MKLKSVIIAAGALLAAQSVAWADAMPSSPTRAEVQAQLAQAYLHDTRAVDEPNSYPNPTSDRHYIARLRQKSYDTSVASH